MPEADADNRGAGSGLPAYVSLNGELVPAGEAKVSVFDRGFACGDSLVETLKLSGGKPVFFREHHERLLEGVEALGIEADIQAAGLRARMEELAAANGVSEGRLRLQLSRGGAPGAAGIDPVAGLKPTLVITAEPFGGYPERLYREGMRLATVRGNRGRWAGLKTSSLVATVLARGEALAGGADEALFTSAHGRLLEGSYTNLFFLAAGELVTAPEEDEILPGIVRGKVLAMAAESGVPLRMEALRLDDLTGVAAGFLTSSLLGICPAASIDDVRLGQAADLLESWRERLAALEEASL